MSDIVTPFLLVDTSPGFDGFDRLCAYLYMPPLPDQGEDDPTSLKLLESPYRVGDMQKSDFDEFITMTHRVAARIGFIPVEQQFTWEQLINVE